MPSAFLGGITGQFFRQFALTISVAMLISAINAMTLTPARAAWIFAKRKPGEHGDQGKEALPWWSFALLGGLVSVWLLASTLGAWLGLPAGRGPRRSGARRPASHFADVGHLPRALPPRRGRRRGARLVHHPARELALGKLFRGFNWVFDWTTQAYGKSVGWCLRLSAIVLLVYVGLIGLTGFGFTRVPSRVRPPPGQGLPAGEHPVARRRLAGAHFRGD